jgi:hypothetical protein
MDSTIMARAVCDAKMNAKFNAFLFARLLEQENGTPVTVLSALMRANHDPWNEAARLARLPSDKAQRALMVLLNEILGRRYSVMEMEDLAIHLVRLLPATVPAGSSAPDSISIAACQLAYWVFWFVFIVSLVVYQSHDWTP